ncbi:MAG: sigma-70 family RNA polymerase sigma factor [Planctomycetaceae bacterium]|nr:sigma-70 family RNA polymerase sigma factor [Planctomycetaceae bacterium]
MAESDEARIERASRGDVRAAEELLERHLPDLRRYVRRRVSPALLAHESTSDLVQSVCREVLQDLAHFRPQDEASFRAWLCQSALRKILDRQRFHAAEKRDRAREAGAFSRDELSALAASFPSPSGDAMRQEELERLERALGELDESDRRLVLLIHLEGLSHAQAAERLGTTEVNSRKQLSRALARLSRLL